ncbi:kynurenine/alpha-aminoadipate aminotransferase, mitochondrial-like [Panulirus ornatus]|uniref:kynurenine/alpha-aminoadipate aminotransferase, mitochondrial-like n=1 Tax=Panulirus ornatus TaxID=150431 RepID=UPI003A853B10
MNYLKYMSELARRVNRPPYEKQFEDKVSANTLQVNDGLTDSSVFPFLKASFTLLDGSSLTVSPRLMTACLQYGSLDGYKQLKEQVEELTNRFHSPPRMSERDIVVTYGAQQGLSLVCNLLLNPGDYVVVEDACYYMIFPILRRLGARTLSIQCDSQGMEPNLLRKALATVTDGVVKMMYLNPCGTNPTGTCMDETRRRDIYNIACENDFIVLEDDPYYFIQFTEKTPPSFLSLDTEGRVLRVDSFSKILSAGLRVGYVTAPKPLAERLIMSVSDSVLQCTALPQVLLSELLCTWGHEGFMQHVKKVCQLYRARRDATLNAADRHLTGLCEWTIPAGGMFLWIKVLGVTDTWILVMERGLKRDVHFTPGCVFKAKEQQPCPYIRVSYSSATVEHIDKALEILAEIIVEEKQESKTP